MDNKNLEKLKKDLKIAVEIEEKIKNIETTKIQSPTEQLLDYGFKYGAIKNTLDIIILAKEFPSLESQISQKYDEYLDQKSKSKIASEKLKIEERARYGGTYDRYSDAPGYGTVWNERCVPEGVHIRQNCRC